MKRISAYDRILVQRAFQMARESIQPGEFICVALQKLSVPRYQTEMARKVIMSRLFPYISIYSFLISEGIQRGQQTTAYMYDYRRLWLDRLIKEFSK